MMPKVSYEIDGKRYTEEEVMSVYEFWRSQLDCEDITDAINHVIDYRVLYANDNFVKKKF